MEAMELNFNLEPYRQKFETLRFPNRVMVAGFSVFMAAAGFYLIVRHLGGGPTTWATGVAYAVIVAIVLFGLWALRFPLGRAASEVRISPEFVCFAYPSGRRRTINWASPDFRLKLFDYRPWVKPGSESTVPIALFARAPGEPYSAISVDAFDAILDRARLAGLGITDQVSLLGGNLNRRILTITPRPNSTHAHSRSGTAEPGR